MHHLHTFGVIELSIWIEDAVDDYLYAYNLSTGARQSSKDVDLPFANANPTGLSGDEFTIWVADVTDDKLYTYSASDGSSVTTAVNIRIPEEVKIPYNPYSSPAFYVDALPSEPEVGGIYYLKADIVNEHLRDDGTMTSAALGSDWFGWAITDSHFSSTAGGTVSETPNHLSELAFKQDGSSFSIRVSSDIALIGPTYLQKPLYRWLGFKLHLLILQTQAELSADNTTILILLQVLCRLSL